MTIDDIRDELARREGWENHPEYGWCHPGVQYEDGRPHPIPATLDEAAKFPEGWKWSVWTDIHKDVSTIRAQAYEVGGREVYSSGDTEMEARFRLRLACTIADDNSTQH